MHVSLAQSASVSEVMICLYAGFQDRTLYETVKCTQATNLAGRLGRSGLTDHVFSDAVTGGNVRSDHHADTCLIIGKRCHGCWRKGIS